MNKSKLLLIAAVGAVVILVGATVVRCTLGSTQTDQDAPEASLAETPGAGASQDPETDTSSHDQGNYASAIEEYLNTRWVSEDAELSLLDGAFIESRGDESAPTYITIEDAREKDGRITLTVAAASSLGTDVSSTLIVIDTTSGVPTISSDLFSFAKSYKLATSAQGAITFQALTDDLSSYLNADTSEITSALTAYLSKYLPSASAASWTGEAYTDFFNDRRLTTFIADDPQASVITLQREADGKLSVL